MINFTREEVLTLIELTKEQTVVGPTAVFPYRITARAPGYSPDVKIAALQQKLSILLAEVSQPNSI